MKLDNNRDPLCLTNKFDKNKFKNTDHMGESKVIIFDGILTDKIYIY